MRLARYGAVLAATAVLVAATTLAFAISACAPACSAQQGGCHPRSSVADERPAAGDDLVCIKDAETGSHIVEVRCFKRNELDERREADRAILDKAQLNSNRPPYRRDQ